MKKVKLKEGNEALKRALLLINYDLKKTLSENKEVVKPLEEQSWSQITKGAATGAATGAAVGATALGGGAIPGAIIGGLVGAVSAAIGNPKMDQVKKLFQACKTEKTKPTLSTDQLDTISDTLNNAIEDLGTDEDAIADAMRQIPTIPDLCALIKAYEYHGDLFSDLDGDLDSDYEWKQYVVLPLRNALRKSQEITTSQASEIPTNRPQFEWVVAPTEEEVKTGKRLLKSGMRGDFVTKVQEQLKVKGADPKGVDGKFGKNTKSAVIKFQEMVGLDDDGIVGKDTYASLFREKDKLISTVTGDVKPGTDTQNSSTIADRGVTIPRVSAPTSGVQRVPTLPAQNAHVDPQPVIRESLKKNLKTKLVEKTQERENLIIESKIITNRFKLISEGLIIETDDDKISFVESVIQETNYLVSQGYNSQAINEGLFDALGSLLGGSFKATPAVFGEYIAKWLLKTLGVPEGSFISSALITLVGNINIKDYDKLFSDCRYTSNLVADTLIEAYVYQMQMKVKGASEGMTGFIVSALRNSVAEYFTEDKDGIIQKLQDKIADFICPKIGKLSNVMSDKTDEIKDKAMA